MAITRYGLTGPMRAYGAFGDKAEGAAVARRGPSARGRARARGRKMFWLVLALAPLWRPA